jgi:hypothetical protein
LLRQETSNSLLAVSASSILCVGAFQRQPNTLEDIMLASQIASFSVRIAAIVGTVCIAVAAPIMGSAMTFADDGGSSQISRPSPDDGNPWDGTRP